MVYTERTMNTKERRQRKRNIIWYNPPYSKNIKTNIGKNFLTLINKHFPKHSKLHQIFNKNNVKVSYSCMGNMSAAIKNHNRRIAAQQNETAPKPCNCRNKDQCPLSGNCQSTSVIYKATVTADNEDEKSYIGLTESTFKSRYNNHKFSFNHDSHANRTELSNYVWNLKRRENPFKIAWSIVATATPYTNETKRCNLCLMEKFFIIYADKNTLLNKKSELISKCRHENKFYLSNHACAPT